MISLRNKGTLADSYIAKGVTKLVKANTSLVYQSTRENTLNRWVSQGTQPIHLTFGFHRLFTVKPTFTFKDQSSQHMGLSDYSQSIHLTTGVYQAT